MVKTEFMGNPTIIPTKIFARPNAFFWTNSALSFRRKIVYLPHVTLQFHKTTTTYTLLVTKPFAKNLWVNQLTNNG